MAFNQSSRREGGSALLNLLAVVVLAFVIGPVVLHFAQKRHNRLPFDMEARFPESEPSVKGEIFASTIAEIVEHELGGGTGWRPNDFVLWGPTLWADNNANRQLGIIQAVRESVRVFKDHLTKVSSDEFDANLVAADTAFRNDALKFWLPSAEGKFSEGVKHLRKYVAGLEQTPPRSKPINRRNVELIRLMQAWTDLLGGAHASLYRDSESVWRTDDVFYHAQGFAHVMYHGSRAISREYQEEIESRPVLRQLFDEVEAALGKAARVKPLVVLDGRASGILANHRRNLDAYISEARQKMYSIREELEK